MIPSSFYCGKSCFLKKNMESLAVARAEGKHHLFVTITCNKNHPDILSAFLVNVSREERVDISIRIFRQKIEELNI